MTHYGYIRKDYPIGIMEQLTCLQAYGCETVYVEQTAFSCEEECQVLVSQLKPGDTVVVASLQVFAKTIKELGELFETFDQQEIRLISVRDDVDTQASEGLSFYQITQLLGREEDAYHRQKMVQRIAEARQAGQMIGRPTVSDEVKERIQQLYLTHKLPLREIANECGVSLGTVHKYVHEAKEKEQLEA